LAGSPQGLFELYQLPDTQPYDAGKSYKIVMEYRGESGAKGVFEVREQSSRPTGNWRDPPLRKPLGSTDDGWEKIELIFTPPNTGPYLIIIQNRSSVMDKNGMYFRNLKVTKELS
jgi:hypothetical protein